MSDNIINFPKAPPLDVSSDAKDMFADLSENSNIAEAVVLGWTKDQQLFVASNMNDGASMQWLLDIAKVFLDEDILIKMKVTWILITLMGSPQAEIASAELNLSLIECAQKAVLINQSEDHNRTVACLPIIKDGTEPKEDIHFTE